MIRPYRDITLIFCTITALALAACSDDDFLLPGDGKNIDVTFMPSLDGELNTRSIGDASEIDRLIVSVYADNNDSRGEFITSDTTTWTEATNNGISLTLIEGRTYHILFWAQDADNTAYTINDDGSISADYTEYTAGGFAKMEQLDAFYATTKVTVGSQKVEDKGAITLTRPLAQVNFADDTTQPIPNTHKAIVNYSTYPVTFNPFTGGIEMSQTPIEFTFTDFPAETLKVNQTTTYYYIASNYLFAPQSGTQAIDVTTLILQDGNGSELKNVQLIDNGTDDNRIILQKNMKTNVHGNIVQQPSQWSVWDDESSPTKPEKDVQNRYIVDQASDIAWLAENGGSLATDATFVQTIDIDMNNLPVESIQLPAGSTYDGEEKTIKNFKNSVFGDATRITVKNLTLDNIQAGESQKRVLTHVGVLVNTLKGSSQFENITIANSSATTTGGAAGGMVGYIVRQSEKTRSETLAVTFSNCKLTDVTVAGSTSEGKMVGLLSGYDNNESLTFDASCEAENVNVTDYSSVYKKANQSAWVAGTLETKYDGWLGHEKYRRAKVSFAGVRMVPRWDGKTDATVKSNLIYHNDESGKYEVQSPYDLAAVRETTGAPSYLYLSENVDMHGQGADGKYFMHSNFKKSYADSSYSTSDDDNHFKSFDYIDYLEGNNNSIYNLSIYSTFNGATTYYGAFILYARNTTTHQNINLYNCCTIVPHVVKDNEDKSYGAAFLCNNDCATYTMNNVHAYGCKVFALQKTGTLVGRLGPNSEGNIDNCTVNNCYIENYECTAHQESFVVTTFYSYGEVGGMFGFVEDFVTISNCHVRGTTIYAFGQSDKWLLITTIPGRHVGTFIGDIRTSDKNGDTILMTNCTVDSNTKCTAGRWDKYSKCEIIGKAYYVSLAGDSKGTVKFNGNPIL